MTKEKVRQQKSKIKPSEGPHTQDKNKRNPDKVEIRLQKMTI